MKNTFLFSTLVLMTLSLSVAGCSTGPDRIYDKNGISFSYPGDWSVTDDEDYGGGSYYLAVEKIGTSPSGIIMINHNEKGVITPEEWLETFIETLEENPHLDELVVQPAIAGTYGNHPSQVVTYTMLAMGLVKHSGTAWFFEASDKFVAVVYQEADEDNAKNMAGFDLIKSTFTVK